MGRMGRMLRAKAGISWSRADFFEHLAAGCRLNRQAICLRDGGWGEVPLAGMKNRGKLRKLKRNLGQPRLDSKGFIAMLSRSGFCTGNDLPKL
ncbi:MAG: hypothetical protein P4N60_23885 [Verrucomicrobiae bacterium]|nr:hypothetical protein [Verrucomicrobiae bacterium]